MKKILLSVAFMFATFVGANAQVTYTNPSVTLSDANGVTMYAEGTLTGTLTSITISATKVSGTSPAGALSVYITPTNAFAPGGLLYAGGLSNAVSATEWQPWPTIDGNDISGTITLTTPITFTETTFVRLANLYLQETQGTWENISITLNGVSEASYAPPANCVDVTSITPSNGATNVNSTDVTLSWTAPAGDDYTGYNVYLGLSEDELVIAASNYTQTSIGPIDWSMYAGETLYWKVVPVNVNTEASCGTNAWSMTFAELPEGVYCSSANATDCSYESITNVTFSGINNTTACDTGLNDYTSMIATVTQGQTYPLSVSIESDSDDYVFVFIDWNKNGKLDDDGEIYTVADGVDTTQAYTLDIEVPADAVVGETRMRVFLAWDNPNLTPCSSVTYGEVEDYTINVQASSSTGDFMTSTFSVYPNPAKDVLNISNNTGAEMSSLTIVDINGRTVKQVNSNVSQINISDLNAGVYFVNIKSNEGSLTTKIVKQ